MNYLKCFLYFKQIATIENEYAKNVMAIDTTTLQTVMLTLNGSRLEHPSNNKPDIVELTGQNFDEELRKRALLVMFHEPM